MSEFPNCEIKLCDLEVSRVIQEHEQIREIIGTPDYVGNSFAFLFKFIALILLDYYFQLLKSWRMSRSVLQRTFGHWECWPMSYSRDSHRLEVRSLG